MSNREHQEVSERERSYEDGTDPKVLDVIDVPLVGARSHEFQQENWLLDPDYYWIKRGRFDWTRLLDFVEPAGPLWVNRNSSYHGLNDRISMKIAVTLRSSLRLIHVDRLTIEVFSPGAAFGNPLALGRQASDPAALIRESEGWYAKTPTWANRMWQAWIGRHGLAGMDWQVSERDAPRLSALHQILSSVAAVCDCRTYSL